MVASNSTLPVRSDKLESETADCEEMTRLLEGRRSRVREALEPWMSARRAELRNDKLEVSDVAALEGCHEDMSRLMASCRPRVVQEIRPWLHHIEQRLRETYADCAGSADPGEGEVEVGVVVIAGDAAQEAKDLFGALSHQGVSQKVDGAVAASDITLETKAYTVRLRLCLVDVSQPTERVKAMVRDADAIVLVHGTVSPATMQASQQLVEAAIPLIDGHEETCGDRDTVQICVVRTQSTGDVAADESMGQQALDWCLQHSFEYLPCPLEKSDLDQVSARIASSQSFAGLLNAADEEDCATRVVEALETHMWPTLVRKNPASKPKAAAAKRHLPTVAFISPRHLPSRKLLQSISGKELSMDEAICSVETTLRTKYYNADLRLELAAIEACLSSAEGTQCLQTVVGEAEGIVLLWDANRPATFEQITDSYMRFTRSLAGKDGNSSGNRPHARASVRLCLAVSGHNPQASEICGAWCIEHGFEMVPCELNDAELEAAKQCWLAGGRSTALLGDANSGLSRVAEALACHVWPGMETLKSESYLCLESSQRTSVSAELETKEREADDSEELLERFVDEVRQVRAMDDSEARRERAMEVAMQMASSMGLDGSDSD